MRKEMKPFIVAMTLFAANAQAQVITASIDASAKGAPIQPLIYGMFVEHIGGLLEQGFRAEMLDDRKFYFAVGRETPPAGRGNRGAPRRTWLPLAADGSVTMDSAHAYASDHVPQVTLAGTESTRHSPGGGRHQSRKGIRGANRHRGRPRRRSVREPRLG
jgi:alpha-N-arabinofuranosidase